MEKYSDQDFRFDKIKPSEKSNYFESSRGKPGHEASYEQAYRIATDPPLVVGLNGGRIGFVDILEGDRTPTLVITSAKTSACSQTGLPINVGILFNAYKDKRTSHLLASTSLSSQENLESL